MKYREFQKNRNVVPLPTSPPALSLIILLSVCDPLILKSLSHPWFFTPLNSIFLSLSSIKSTFKIVFKLVSSFCPLLPKPKPSSLHGITLIFLIGFLAYTLIIIKQILHPEGSMIFFKIYMWLYNGPKESLPIISTVLRMKPKLFSVI